MKTRADSPVRPDICASLPATKADPVNAIGASVDISAGQEVVGLNYATRHRHAKRTPPPDRIRLGTGGTRGNRTGRLRVFIARHAARADLAPDPPSTILELAALR